MTDPGPDREALRRALRDLYEALHTSTDRTRVRDALIRAMQLAGPVEDPPGPVTTTLVECYWDFLHGVRTFDPTQQAYKIHLLLDNL